MANSYAKSTSLVKTSDVIKIDATRAKEGWYIPAPTVMELLRRRNYLKAWYQPRDFMFEMFISMARLENPFGSTKDSLANKNTHLTGNAQNKYTIATSPFDALTLAMSMVADKHPYVTTFPTHKSHTDARMGEFDRFAQGAIDTASNQSDFMMDMLNKLAVTGWLPTLSIFDPARQKQGVFPFDLQILDPLDVYPQLDAQRRPIYTFIEHHLNGAQLLQTYSMFAGVAEIYDAECGPDESNTSEYEKYCLEGNNFLTTEFDVSEYYDDTYRAILIGCGDATETACRYNPALKNLKDKSSKGKMASVMHGSDYEDDPYCGIEEHHLGCLPLNLEGCWPEPVGPANRGRYGHTATTTTTGGATMGSYANRTWGKLVYYPFLFSMRNNWIDQSKLRDMIYSAIDAWADPQLKVKSSNTKAFANVKDQKVVFVDPDANEDYGIVAPPPMPPEVMALMNYVDQEIKNGSYAGVAYGMRGGTSARQAEAAIMQGTVREQILVRAVERSIAQYPKKITHTLIERGGDEEVFVRGNGTKYGSGQGYTQTYSAKDLQGVVPEIVVELKAKNGLKDPANVMAYNSLKQTKDFDTAFLMRTVLDIVNPEKIIEDAKREMISADVSVLKPQVEVAALAASQQELQTKWKIQEQIQLATDQYQHQTDMKQVEQDMSQLSEEQHAAVERATIQRILAAAQGQDQNGGVPGAGPASATTPGMTPPGGLPPNLQAPGLTSSPSPAGPPLPMMGPPMPSPMPLATRPPMPLPPPMMGLGQPHPHPPMPMPPMRPPVPMPMPQQHRPLPLPVRPPGPGLGQPPGRPNLSGLPSDFAKGPGQRNRIQPLSAYQPSGGIGRPGVPAGLMSGAGLHGTPMDTPHIEAVNAAFKPLTLQAAVSAGRKRKRGSRGR